MFCKDKKSFGKELEAVIGVANEAVELSNKNGPLVLSSANLKQLAPSSIRPGSYQPRKNFDDEALQELAVSIRKQGILQPILVKEGKDRYEIIVGERRWRAAKIAGLLQIPAIICDISSEAALAFGLIENIQRKELNAIEEAQAFKRLLTEFSLTHEEVANYVGKSRATITNLLRLLSLPEDVQSLIVNGELDMGHARTILTLNDNDMRFVIKEIIDKRLSVRDVEKLVYNLKNKNLSKQKSRYIANEKVVELEKKLSDKFYTKVKIKLNEINGGKVLIFFDAIEQIEKLTNLQ